VATVQSSPSSRPVSAATGIGESSDRERSLLTSGIAGVASLTFASADATSPVAFPELNAALASSTPASQVISACPLHSILYLPRSDFYGTQMSENIKQFWSDRRLEILASTRTILNVFEKGLDGVPIPGLKAAVGAASEGLKALQVHEAFILLFKLSPSFSD
jgi:hypothetical protein